MAALPRGRPALPRAAPAGGLRRSDGRRSRPARAGASACSPGPPVPRTPTRRRRSPLPGRCERLGHSYGSPGADTSPARIARSSALGRLTDALEACDSQQTSDGGGRYRDERVHHRCARGLPERRQPGCEQGQRRQGRAVPVECHPGKQGAPDFLLDVDGIVGSITNDAIGGFQQFQFGFMDHLVEPGKITIQRMNQVQRRFPAGVTVANEELRSWATRRTPQWNFTRAHVALANLAGGFTFSSDCKRCSPPNYRANLVKAFSTILNPGASSPGSWGDQPVRPLPLPRDGAGRNGELRRSGPGDPTTRSRHEGRAVPAAGQRHVGRDRHDHDRCTGPGVPAASADRAPTGPGSWPRVLHSVPASGSSTTASRERHRPACGNAIQRPSSLLALARAYAGAGRRAVRADDFSGPWAPTSSSAALASSSTSSGSHVVPGSRLSLSAPTGLPEADLI